MAQEKEHSPLKIILAVVGIISAIEILSRVFGKDERGEEQDAAHESRKKLYKEVTPSFQEHTYSDFADILETALTGSTTEDEESVYMVFSEMKNISDVNRLIEAYGHRRMMFSYSNYSLPQTISELFNPGEKKKLNDILKKKKIDYRFT